LFHESLFIAGDHAYKQSEGLSAQEQMITALPDVRTLMIDPAEDEFMVLACDGIWNFMSSQEVVDFVRPRIQEGQTKLSQICEEVRGSGEGRKSGIKGDMNEEKKKRTVIGPLLA
jgi:serine/threonine protein phosphatase PrpC